MFEFIWSSFATKLIKIDFPQSKMKLSLFCFWIIVLYIIYWKISLIFSIYTNCSLLVRLSVCLKTMWLLKWYHFSVWPCPSAHAYMMYCLEWPGRYKDHLFFVPFVKFQCYLFPASKKHNITTVFLLKSPFCLSREWSFYVLDIKQLKHYRQFKTQGWKLVCLFYLYGVLYNYHFPTSACSMEFITYAFS